MDVPSTKARGSVAKPSSDGERGSILIAAVLFLFFVFLVAGMAVDVGRYYLQAEQAQNIADGAALAGARALGQYDFNVNEGKVHSQVRKYIEANYGKEHTKLYARDSSGGLKDVHVARFSADTSSRNCQSFSINNGSMRANQPTTARTEVLGTALQVGNNPLPVTAKIRISDPDDPNVSSETEPWGSFEDPNHGDLNDGGSNRDVDLNHIDKGMQVDIVARSWQNGSEKMTVTTGEDNAFTFKEGDNVFDEPGYRGQGSTGDFVEDYVNEDGEIDIQNNQAIVFFELFANPDSNAPFNDKQDLVVLLTFGRASSSGGGRFGGRTPAWMTQNGTPCGNSMPVYRVGVPVYDSFEPLFLPESVFGSRQEQANGIVRTAVAEVRPQVLRRYGRRSVNCAAYSGGSASVNSKGIRVTSSRGNGGSLCTNGSVNVNSSSGRIDQVVISDNGTLGGPGSRLASSVSRFSGTRQVPSLSSAATNITNFTVDMTESNYNASFFDEAQCDADEGAFYEDTEEADLAMVTRGNPGTGEPVEWAGSGDPVCVSKNNGQFKIAGSGKIVRANNPGQSLTIYTDQDVQISGQIELHGGIVSSSSITVNGAGHRVTGDPKNVGGAALWAGDNLTVNMNMSAAGAVLRGIVGANGDVTFGPTADNAPAVQGILVAGGNLTLRGNNRLNLIHDPSAYDGSVFTGGGNWTRRTSQAMGNTIPPMAEATVRLVH